MPEKSRSDAPIYALSDSSKLNPSTSRKALIRQLNDILHLSVERGDLARARRAWAILVRCKEFDWKANWRTSLLLLPKDTSSQPSGGRDIGLLRKMMHHYPEEKESILQEIVLRMVNSGDFREALDELDLYLPSFPYQDNPMLHSYAGLISLYLFQDSHGASISLLRAAREHFNRSLSIDADNDVAKSFLEEVSRQLTSAVSLSKVSVDAESEDDMEIDVIGGNNGSRLRPKRAKQTTDPD